MILDFDNDSGPSHFEFVFVGFVLGGSMQERKGIQILRTEVGVFEKLESISEPKPCGKKLVNGEPVRQLIGKQLQLTMQEFDLLFNYIAQVPWQSGTPVKKAVETLDWLQSESRKDSGRS